MKYNWNKPYQLVMKIKNDYLNSGGDKNNYEFENWVSYLNKKEYNDFIEPLQINQCKEFILIRYGLQDMQRGMWEDKNSIYRQCRSLVIDLKNEEIVLSPFRKFFNAFENGVKENTMENLVEEIKNAKVLEFSNKLDGSMQSFRWYNGEIFGSGSMALSKENSWRLEDGFNMLTESHIKMMKLYPEFTFVFEYISKKDTHVVIYNKDNFGLHLIGMIDTRTGSEYNYDYIIKVAQSYNVKVVKKESVTFDEVLILSKKYKSNEKEGWVVNIDGRKVKIKCDDYVSLHRMLDKLSSVNLIIESIADNKFDDLISKLPEIYRYKVLELSDKIYDWINKTSNEIEFWFEKAPKHSRKDFMIWCDKEVPKYINKYIKAKFLNREYNLIKSNNGSYKKIKDILGHNYELKVTL